jgi:hypothetical protein
MILNKEKMKNTQHGLLSRKIISKLVTKGITLTMKLITCKYFYFYLFISIWILTPCVVQK